jgi:hypothetical protein
MSEETKPVRLFFHKAYEHVTAEGAKLYYRAGEFYHVAEEYVAEFLQKEVAKTEHALELEAEAAAIEAAEDQAKAEALDAEPAPAAVAE